MDGKCYRIIMEIESKQVTVNKPNIELFNYLKDVKNFKELMPENMSKFEIIDDTSFVFALQGMPEIALEIKETNPHKKIVLGAINNTFPFTLTAIIESVNDASSNAHLLFSGNFNPMMKMMIKKPITKFIETLISNMQKP